MNVQTLNRGNKSFDRHDNADIRSRLSGLIDTKSDWSSLPGRRSELSSARGIAFGLILGGISWAAMGAGIFLVWHLI